MNLDDFKMVFVGVFLVLVLVAASPTLSMMISLPAGERFTELWILGPGHMAEGYPFNARADVSYSVFLGVGNHMGGLEYYLAYVKFRNQTESLPNATMSTPSLVPSLYEYRTFLSEGEAWEKNVTFSFSGVSVAGNVCRVSYLSVGGCGFFVDRFVAYNSTYNGYYFELFFELWRFDVGVSEFRYHNRFVGIRLNMTSS